MSQLWCECCKTQSWLWWHWQTKRREDAGDWQAGGTQGCTGVVTHTVSAEDVSGQQGAAGQGFTTAAQGAQLKHPYITAPVTLLILPWWHPQAGGSHLATRLEGRETPSLSST